MQNIQNTGPRQLCLRLMRYVAPYWDALILSTACMIATAATVPMLAALMQPTMEEVIANRNPELLQLVLLGIISLFAVRAIAGHLATYVLHWAGSKLVVDLLCEIFDKLLVLPHSYYESCPGSNHISVDHVSRITSDAPEVARAFVNVVTVMIKDTFTVIGLLAWMFYLNWTLALLILLMSSVILLVTQLLGERLREMGRESGRAIEGLTRILKGSALNFMVVKLYGGEQYENRRMREQAEETRRFFMKRVAVASLYVPLIQTIGAAAIVLTLYFAANEAVAGEITAGSFASLITAILLLIAPARRIAEVGETLQRGLLAAGSLFSLLDGEVESETGTVVIQRVRGELQFEEVGYGERGERNPDTSLKIHSLASLANSDPAAARRRGLNIGLHDVTLIVQPGETVAVVGCAETMDVLTCMVPRFLNPTSGRILLDGHDLRSITLASLRANIALVSPHTALFNDSVAANIAYGAMGRATEARITWAARAAHASEFIRKLPDGLQTVVGEGGVELPISQRLRIAVARALLKNAPLLILNEKLGMIEPESVSLVQAALDTAMQGRTTFVIADRLSTLEKADQVVMVDKERIVERGSHRELMARDGAYTRLIRRLFGSKAAVAAR
ncbi:ABC transporter transmembrane domain-containing protein [Nitrosospira multiformis]|nr:ABC transporter transmembrane domain-containing protein [Nitrosospira multiformis]